MKTIVSGFARWLAAACIAVSGSALAADGVPSFFKAAPKAAAKAKPVGLLSPATPVAFNADELFAMRAGDEADIPLGPKSRRAVLEKTISHPGGDQSWIGHLKERGKQSRVIVTSGPSGAYGVIESPDGVYRIVPGNGADWLVNEDDETALAPQFAAKDDGIVVENHGLPAGDPKQASYVRPLIIPGAKAAPTPQAVVDVMFVLTQGLANALGGNLVTRLNFIVTRANDSYTASDIGITLRYVGFMTVNYPDDTNDNAALDGITPGRAQFNSAIFGGVESQRTAFGADLVMFLRNGSGGGGSGLAWVPRPASSNFMYGTVQGCVTGCEHVIIHEMGHNMGNSHDRFTAAQQAGGVTNAQLNTNNGNTVAYGYPFCKSGALPAALNCNPNVAGGCGTTPECAASDPSNFSDIMSYFFSSQKIYRFSNPLQNNCVSTRAGNDGVLRACGLAAADALSADTAGAMNAARATLSGIKATTVGASLQFTSATFSAAETAGSMTFTVSRTGDSTGAVSVNYTVTSNTAISGIDFAAAPPGTLNWAAGDTANKTFTVTLTNDQAAEGVESFTATLSNPVGTPSAILGSPSVANGVITEAWPPGGAVAPPGFGTAPGSSAIWNFANDFSADGDNISLKSGALTFFPPAGSTGCTSQYGTIPCPSALQWSGTTGAGPVSFAYQVNSYPDNGFFEFLVDGTVVLTDSGLPSTKSFSYNLTAGGHTLVWRYRPLFNFPCNNVNPPAPQGSSCADRAWIDSVSIPVSLPASSVSVSSSAPTTGTGQSVTFTATITGTNGGTVAFRSDGALIAGCNAQPIASNQATCTTTALAAGTHQITAAYSGSSAVAASISNPINQTIISNVSLTVAKSGNGSGTVSSNPAGISCGATCNATVPGGAPITLSAAPAAGSIFTGWTGGGCSGVSSCTISPIQATSVTATFVLSAGAPTPALNNPGLDFGGQSVKTTAPAIVMNVVNAGSGTLTVSSITPSTADYTATHNCTTLTQGAACPVTVRFTPQAAGARNATLNIVTSGGTQSPAMTGTGELSLVTHYYRAILGRAPDSSGKAFWEGEASRMTSLGANINETWFVMAGYFYNSAEYLSYGRNDTGFVTDLYNTFFNRGPDAGGLNFWVGQIQSGLPREVVLFSFMFSPEFATFTQGIFGNTTVRPEINVVMDFFRGILNRLPDTGSYNFWLGQVRTAQCQGANAVYAQIDSMSSAFIFNPEYNNRNRNNTQFVTDMYYSFLRRGGDKAGVDFWINQLQTGAKTVNTVRADFIGTPEFAGRVQAVINAGCFTGP